MTAAAMTATVRLPGLDGRDNSHDEGTVMYGYLGSLRTQPGQRDTVIAILLRDALPPGGAGTASSNSDALKALDTACLDRVTTVVVKSRHACREVLRLNGGRPTCRRTR